MSVQETISNFIKEKFEIGDDPDFNNDVHLFNERFVDSFGAVEIIHFIEEQDVNKIKEILNLNNVASLEELNKKKRFFLAVPGF